MAMVDAEKLLSMRDGKVRPAYSRLRITCSAARIVLL